MGQDGGSGLDITSVSHALGSILQELQIPVRSDQGHLSRDSQPIKCASHSISAVLNPHPSSLSSKPDPEVFFLFISLGFLEPGGVSALKLETPGRR